jgi:hypothetical protein
MPGLRKTGELLGLFVVYTYIVHTLHTSKVFHLMSRNDNGKLDMYLWISYRELCAVCCVAISISSRDRYEEERENIYNENVSYNFKGFYGPLNVKSHGPLLLNIMNS